MLMIAAHRPLSGHSDSLPWKDVFAEAHIEDKGIIGCRSRQAKSNHAGCYRRERISSSSFHGLWVKVHDVEASGYP